MKLIKPKLISGEIMTLIEEADRTLIIISPYYDIGKWDKLLNTFNDLKNKQVTVEFYVRQNEQPSFNEIKQIGFTPFEIPNLHTKLYLNENLGIVSSMNLTACSDKKSLDIAYKTETKEEYEELYNYYKRHIQKFSIKQPIVRKINQQVIKEEKAAISIKPFEFSELEKVPSFKDFLINDHALNYLNWKQIVVDFIREKLKCKHARQYIKDNSMYFYTNILNFGCFFDNLKSKTYFSIKIDCSEGLYSMITQNMNDLINESGANIKTGSAQHGFTQIFINYDQEMKSRDFDFVNNEDLPAMIKTIGCALFVLCYADKHMKLNPVFSQSGKQRLYP